MLTWKQSSIVSEWVIYALHSMKRRHIRFTLLSRIFQEFSYCPSICRLLVIRFFWSPGQNYTGIATAAGSYFLESVCRASMTGKNLQIKGCNWHYLLACKSGTFNPIINNIQQLGHKAKSYICTVNYAFSAAYEQQHNYAHPSHRRQFTMWNPHFLRPYTMTAL